MFFVVLLHWTHSLFSNELQVVALIFWCIFLLHTCTKMMCFFKKCNCFCYIELRQECVNFLQALKSEMLCEMFWIIEIPMRQYRKEAQRWYVHIGCCHPAHNVNFYETMSVYSRAYALSTRVDNDILLDISSNRSWWKLLRHITNFFKIQIVSNLNPSQAKPSQAKPNEVKEKKTKE